MRAMVMGAVAAVTLAAGGASAATMTFNGGQILPGNVYVENLIRGITPDGFNLISGDLNSHLDDSGRGFDNSNLRFTTGGIFSAKSFDISPDNYSSFENVQILGYLGGAVVASERFNMNDVADVGEFATYSFDDRFAELDSLFIGFASIPQSVSDNGCGSPCTHFTIDNVTLDFLTPPAPVPLPASGLLLAGGLAALALRRKRTC